jgi:hypothetical protein
MFFARIKKISLTIRISGALVFLFTGATICLRFFILPLFTVFVLVLLCSSATICLQFFYFFVVFRFLSMQEIHQEF